MPYIGLQPPASPVTTIDIQAGAISNTDLAVGAVTPHSIGTGAITAGKVATGGISANTQLASGVVTSHATAADIAKTDVRNTFTVAQRASISDLGVRSGGGGNLTVTLDMNTANHFKLVANGNITIANPTNLTVGQGGSIVVTSNGSYTTSFGSQWRYATGTAPTLSTSAGKEDRIDYYVSSANTIHCVATIDLLGTA